MKYSVENLSKTIKFKLRELAEHKSSAALVEKNREDWFENTLKIKKLEKIKINYGKQINRDCLSGPTVRLEFESHSFSLNLFFSFFSFI